MLNHKKKTRINLIEELSKCNCCHRHTLNRPSLADIDRIGTDRYYDHAEYTNYYIEVELGLREEDLCGCDCRHKTRLLFSRYDPDSFFHDGYDLFGHPGDLSLYSFKEYIRYRKYSVNEAKYNWAHSIPMRNYFNWKVKVRINDEEFRLPVFDLVNSGRSDMIREYFNIKDYDPRCPFHQFNQYNIS